MRQLDENSTVAQFITLHILFSISLALMLSSLMTTALGSLPPTLYGHGSAIVNTIQQLAGAAGTALLVVSLTLGAQLSAEAGAPEEMATADGTQSAMTVALIMGLIALVFSLFVKPVPKYSQ